MYGKLGDYKSLVTLYVDSFQWDNVRTDDYCAVIKKSIKMCGKAIIITVSALHTQAFDLVRTHSEYRSDVYFPYATWLIENDRFDEAQEGQSRTVDMQLYQNRYYMSVCIHVPVALDKAGRQTEALHLLEQLAENAITETRYLVYQF